MAEAIDFETASFKVMYTCVALLILKIFFMVPLTARLRFKKKVVMNSEDTKLMSGLKVRFNDPDIERVKRAHLNDLENIPIFISLAYLYTALKPNPLVSSFLVITYTLARFAHTYVYAIVPTKQPARFICYSIGYVISVYMAVNIILTLKD